MANVYFFFFFFNDTATTEIYTLSLHDALPIGAPACSACSDFHFSLNFIPSAGSVHASAKRATHCCQACCCSGKRVSRPFTSFTEPSGEIVKSMLLP